MKKQQMVGLAATGFILFNAPVLKLFDVDSSFFSIPLVYLYLFISWGALIGISAWINLGIEKPASYPIPEKVLDTLNKDEIRNQGDQ